MEPALLAVGSNPLTFDKLLLTLGFQIGILGIGTMSASLIVVPWLYRMESRAMSSPRGVWRFYRLLPSYIFKGVCFILLIGTLGILLTDVGWQKAIQDYLTTSPSTCVNPGSLNQTAYPCEITSGWQNVLLFARASGAPNGAHLLSYIPLPILGIYVAWKYRQDVLLDCFQGILVVGFGVAVHEGLWLIEYWAEFAKYWNLAVASNIVEDFGFGITCIMLGYAFWKYPYRKIPMRVFIIPVICQMIIWIAWWAVGFPITTINNWQLGQGVYMTTQWWGDPFVNFIEILSWVVPALTFFIMIHHEPIKR